MSASSNLDIFDKAIAGYKKKIYKEAYESVKKIAVRALHDAIWYRYQANGCNFTGNLLNSICVVVLNNTRITKCGKSKLVYYASPLAQDITDGGEKIDKVEAPVQKLGTGGYHEKMSPNRHEGRYFFSKTYDGLEGVTITAESIPISTSNHTGNVDAQRFAYQAGSGAELRGDDIFTIIVAYATEYADYIEWTRRSSGFLPTETATWLHAGIYFEEIY